MNKAGMVVYVYYPATQEEYIGGSWSKASPSKKQEALSEK
jgi:hypothetical protein